LNQRLICECIGIEKPYERISEQIWILSVVEPPFHFIEVSIQMLSRELMIRASDRPLEEAPDTFPAPG
jgi:hypothetical protein